MSGREQMPGRHATRCSVLAMRRDTCPCRRPRDVGHAAPTPKVRREWPLTDGRITDVKINFDDSVDESATQSPPWRRGRARSTLVC